MFTVIYLLNSFDIRTPWKYQVVGEGNQVGERGKEKGKIKKEGKVMKEKGITRLDQVGEEKAGVFKFATNLISFPNLPFST